MRAPLLAALLLAPLAPAASGGEDALLVHVRIEGAYAQLWSGEVALGDAYTLVASGGRTHTLDARTPLGALAAAAEKAGLALEVSDEYSDFVVRGVAGEAWYSTQWWDYRVDWVEPNYGAQRHWLAWGPGLRDGSEVLWYVDRSGMTPLRAAPLASAPGPPCWHALRVETLALDVQHQPGQPWPPVAWRPAPLARVAGSASGPVAAGLGLAASQGAGEAWAEEQPLPVAPLVHYIRSPRVALPC